MKNTPIATYIILAINFLAFAALAGQQQSLLGGADDALAILNAGANFNPFTLGGEPWRLITSMFLHFGVIHLLVNMYALFNLGRYLETAIGSPRFALIYFICGVASGMASLVFNVYANSAGASGALFGLFGYQLGAELIGTAGDRQQRQAVITNFVIFLVINLWITLSVNVDLAGHIGGCVAGVLIAVTHFKLRALIDNWKLAIVLAVLPFLLIVLPKGQLAYFRLLKRIIATEEKTNDLRQVNGSDAVVADSLHAVRDEWKGIQQQVKALPAIPASLQPDTTFIQRYAKLNEQLTYYRIKLYERQSFIYEDSIGQLSKMISDLPGLRGTPGIVMLALGRGRPAEEPSDTLRREPTSSALRPKRQYYDSAWKEIDDPNVAAYYREGTVDSVGRWQGDVTDHFRNGDIQMRGTYLDGMKHGIFIYYTERRTYSSAGRYDREQAVGKWENFHWNGALESEVMYGDNAYTHAVFDSLGHEQVVNGEGVVTTYYPSGQIREQGGYSRGRKEGDWLGYHPDGKPYFKEMYRDNRIIRGVSQDQQGRRYVYDQLSLYAFPDAGMPAFQKYLIENIRNPNDGASGTVKVVFNVGVDGARWDYLVIQSVSPACDREAIRVVREGPSWRPGVLHGHAKIPSQGYAEVSF